MSDVKTPDSSSPKWWFLWPTSKIIVVVFAFVILLELIVLAMRVLSVWDQGALTGTTGMEGVVVYPIWKVIHGFPLYEWPFRFPFTSTPYNFLFFYFYALPFRLLGESGANILLYGKYITFAFAVAGATLQYHLCRILVPHINDAQARFVLAAGAILTWFGTGFTSWWALSVRPDLPGTVLSLLGFLTAIKALDADRRSWMALASILFFLAWGFKQSIIGFSTGLGLYLLYRRRWSDVVALSVPFAILSAITFCIGGEVYRYNIVEFTFDLRTRGLWLIAQRLLMVVLGPNFFTWCIGVVGLIAFYYLGGRRRHEHIDPSNPPMGYFRHRTLIFVTLAVNAVLGLAAFSYLGSSRNQFFQAYLLAATLTSLILAMAIRVKPTRATRAVLAMASIFLVFTGVVPALQIAFPNQYGTQRSYAADVFDARISFRDYLQTLGKPVFIDDDTFALPWVASDNQYPAFPLDNIYYVEASKKGIIEDGGFEDLIKRGCFATLVIAGSNPWVEVAINAQYLKEPLEPLWAKALDVRVPWVRLTRMIPRDTSCPF